MPERYKYIESMAHKKHDFAESHTGCTLGVIFAILILAVFFGQPW